MSAHCRRRYLLLVILRWVSNSTEYPRIVLVYVGASTTAFVSSFAIAHYKLSTPACGEACTCTLCYRRRLHRGEQSLLVAVIILFSSSESRCVASIVSFLVTQLVLFHKGSARQVQWQVSGDAENQHLPLDPRLLHLKLDHHGPLFSGFRRGIFARPFKTMSCILSAMFRNLGIRSVRT